MLNITKAAMIGHLHMLWWWCAAEVDDGVLEQYAYDDIAEGADWEGNPDEFVNVLLTCDPKGGPGFLDPSPLRIHDWREFIGKLLDFRAREAKRLQDYRAGRTPERTPYGTADDTQYGTQCDTCTVGRTYVVDRNRYRNHHRNQDLDLQPSPTNVNDSSSSTPQAASVSDDGDTVEKPVSAPKRRTRSSIADVEKQLTDYERGLWGKFWTHYPRKVDRIAALRAFISVIRTVTGDDAQLALAIRMGESLRAYVKEVAGKEMQYVKHPATWLNKGSWDNGDQPATVQRPDGLTGIDAMKQDAEEVAENARENQRRFEESQRTGEPSGLSPMQEWCEREVQKIRTKQSRSDGCVT
jgi:hypothetical protein